MTDYTTMTTAELAVAESAIAAEQSRRNTLERLPGMAASLATQYRAVGGDPQDLISAILAEGTP